ncbi:hypothetical protein D3C87_1673280 [compost metagenome]
MATGAAAIALAVVATGLATGAGVWAEGASGAGWTDGAAAGAGDDAGTDVAVMVTAVGPWETGRAAALSGRGLVVSSEAIGSGATSGEVEAAGAAVGAWRGAAAA